MTLIQRLARVSFYAISAMFIFVAVSVLATCFGEPEPLSRQQRIEKLFSPIDGTLPALVDTVKDHMAAPQSFEAIQTRYTDMGTTLVVQMDFLAANYYGVQLRHRAVATTDTLGHVLTLEVEGGAR